ncbi:hypothetical protein [Frankia sp. KB5]|uniref:hypothetical protein n=1 Tax=Frankia sp. KB5 TaxID=683318 RepID=UPI0010563417|nr:hypothetical protein [Frankia sp. KB5]
MTPTPTPPHTPGQDHARTDTAGRRRSRGRGYTVIGIRDLDGSLTVAGVIAGDVFLADSEPGPEHASRWADYFPDADNPDTAERLAHDQCADG